MYKAKTILKNSGIVLAAMAAVPVILYGMVFTLSIANAAQSPKYFVCKYVGTPGTNERLQTGQNPISVSGNAINPFPGVGKYFADQHGRSFVLSEDTTAPGPAGDPEVSECPAPTPDDEDPEVPAPKECEAGSTLQGYKDEAKQEPICKLDPTGCPYGDSIPLDSPKCVAPNEVENTTSTPVINEETEVFYGKQLTDFSERV